MFSIDLLYVIKREEVNHFKVSLHGSCVAQQRNTIERQLSCSFNIITHIPTCRQATAHAHQRENINAPQHTFLMNCLHEHLYFVCLTGSGAHNAGIGHVERLPGEAASPQLCLFPPRKQLTFAELRRLHRYAQMKR